MPRRRARQSAHAVNVALPTKPVAQGCSRAARRRARSCATEEPAAEPPSEELQDLRLLTDLGLVHPQEELPPASEPDDEIGDEFEDLTNEEPEPTV